jgi:hypothetical protein
MSQFKPEVGDVFENGYGKKILVLQVWDFKSENSHADCIAEACHPYPFYLETRHIPLKDFEFLTYIGRNETESKDLFKTESNNG